MTDKTKLKLVIDFLMTIVLLTLMAYPLTGEKVHSHIGMVMIVLFLLHNLWNFSWYRSLLKGKYTILRTVKTIVNLAFFVCMLAAAGSGIFLAVQASDGSDVAQTATIEAVHMASSHLMVVLMIVHLLLHGGMLRGMIKKWRTSS